MTITTTSGQPIKTYQELLKCVGKTLGGVVDDEFYHTYEGEVLIDGERHKVYRHWSHHDSQLGFYVGSSLRFYVAPGLESDWVPYVVDGKRVMCEHGVHELWDKSLVLWDNQESVHA
jgi:hypothetical protein